MDIHKQFNISYVKLNDFEKSYTLIESFHNSKNLYYCIGKKTKNIFLVQLHFADLDESALMAILTLSKSTNKHILKMENQIIINNNQIMIPFEYSDIKLLKYLRYCQPNFQQRLRIIQQLMKILVTASESKVSLGIFDISSFFIENFDFPLLKLLFRSLESFHSETVKRDLKRNDPRYWLAMMLTLCFESEILEKNRQVDGLMKMSGTATRDSVNFSQIEEIKGIREKLVFSMKTKGNLNDAMNEAFNTLNVIFNQNNVDCVNFINFNNSGFEKNNKESDFGIKANIKNFVNINHINKEKNDQKLFRSETQSSTKEMNYVNNNNNNTIQNNNNFKSQTSQFDQKSNQRNFQQNGQNNFNNNNCVSSSSSNLNQNQNQNQINPQINLNHFASTTTTTNNAFFYNNPFLVMNPLFLPYTIQAYPFHQNWSNNNLNNIFINYNNNFNMNSLLNMKPFQDFQNSINNNFIYNNQQQHNLIDNLINEFKSNNTVNPLLQNFNKNSLNHNYQPNDTLETAKNYQMSCDHLINNNNFDYKQANLHKHKEEKHDERLKYKEKHQNINNNELLLKKKERQHHLKENNGSSVGNKSLDHHHNQYYYNDVNFNELFQSEKKRRTVISEEDKALIKAIDNPKRCLSFRNKLKKTELERTRKLKQKVEEFEPRYREEMEKLSTQPRHKFMMESFPEHFEINHYVTHVMILKERLKNIKNNVYIPNKSHYYFSNNNEETNSKEKTTTFLKIKHSVKKVWCANSLSDENCKFFLKLVNEFIYLIERVWPYKSLSWSEELVLQFLFFNNSDKEKTFNDIKSQSCNFYDFINGN